MMPQESKYDLEKQEHQRWMKNSFKTSTPGVDVIGVDDIKLALFNTNVLTK